MTLGLPAEKGLYPAVHSVSAFTIGNTLTETWRGVSVIWSYSSADKSIVCIFDYLHVPDPTAFQYNFGSITMTDFDYFC